ncbi:MAG: MotA/TolQ/ExbB proton channel family protein [Bacteroidota bacterium]
MIELFQMGGILFMSILTFQLVGLMVFSGRSILRKGNNPRHLDVIKSIGLLAAITGILGQVIGLFSMLASVEQVGGVSPAMLAGGLKVSFITTTYGLIIYAIALLVSSLLKVRST